MRAFRSWCAQATTLRRLHGCLTVLWLLLAIPAAMWWTHSLPFLVAVSVYANVAGHAAAWQAARVEVQAEAAS